MVAAEAQVEALQIRQVADKQAGGAQQRHRKRHLRHHQALAKTPPQPGFAGPPRVAQGSGRSAPGRAPGGSQSEQDAGQQRDSGGEEQHHPVGPHLEFDALPPAGNDTHQSARAPIRQQGAQQPARRGQQQGLGQPLAQQAKPARAQRDAQCHFPLARRPARQQQAGHIGTCDQQQQRHHAHQQQCRLLILIAQVRETGCGGLHFHLPVANAAIVVGLELVLDGPLEQHGHLRAGLLDGYTRLQPRR